jgi:hypothetical protein
MRRGLPFRCPAPRLLACFASSSENYTSRKTAISPLHPAISTRRRGRGAGRFYTRSKRPATPRGECDGSCAADPPGTRMRWSVRGMNARRRGSASGRRARVRRRRGAHIMWCLAMHRRRQQNNTKGSLTPAPRAPMGSPPAADTRNGVRQQTRAVRAAGAALPRCPSPRSADLKQARQMFQNRDAMGGAAPRPSTSTMVLCTGTRGSLVRCPLRQRRPGRAARAAGRRTRSSRFSARFSARFSERRNRANFPPKKISTI